VTSFRQIEANRRNAARSTGPVSELGKHRSRRNAVRHGLCAETVVGMLEDLDDYKGFEAAIIADYDAETAVDRELVLRLASLLWRLRRATSIETQLLHTQAETLRDRRRLIGQTCEILGGPSPCNRPATDQIFDGLNADDPSLGPPRSLESGRDLSLCFQRLANFDSAAFDRLGRYESALARQMVQVMFLLQTRGGRRLFRRP
jgi:hypothetical protein